MRRFCSALIVVAMVIGILPTHILPMSAEAFGDLTYSISNDTATITGCNTTVTGAIEIPAKIEGYPVTIVGNAAFQNCTGLASVTIPNSVTTIDLNAFRGCTGLVSVTIPDSVTTIGANAFYDCTALASITLSDSITSIGASAFYNTAFYNNANNWTGNVLYINNHLIKAQTTLSGVYTIKTGTRCVAKSAFNGCKSLTDVAIPNGVTTIGEQAFEYCTGLTRVIIPNSVTVIENFAFNKCSNIVSVTLPDSITAIGKYAFRYCTALTSITLPKNVTTIGDYAFQDCTGLTSITIPNKATTIGSYSFKNCTELANITIPNSVTYIGMSTFENTAYYNDVNNWRNEVLYISNHLIEAKNTLNGAYTIEAGTICLARNSFKNCTGLTSIAIPNSVTTIVYGAFEGCSGLTRVDITNLSAWCKINFENATMNPLYYAKNLYLNGELVTELVIPSDVTVLGSCIFAFSTSLKKVTIPNGVTTIGLGAFYGCTDLTSIVIPDSVEMIDHIAFYGCTGLENITLGKNVTTIGRNTFRDCSGLNEVYYRGSESDRVNIYIDYGNTELTDAIWHYESCIGSDKHTYDHALDSTCNVCGAERTSLGHNYDGDCDPYCNYCGAKRKVPAHTYDHDADSDCNICGYIRKIGDANGDGIVTVVDVSALLNCLHNKEKQDSVIMDLNHDGQITLGDALRLLKQLSE